MYISMPMLSDRTHLGWTGSGDVTEGQLLRDGVLVAEHDELGNIQVDGLPKEEAQYVYTTSVTRARKDAPSGRIDVSWSFRSAHVDGDVQQSLPLLVIRYRPELDAGNTAPASAAVTFPVTVERQAGSKPATLVGLTVEASYDGGATWTPVELRGSGAERTAAMKNPASGTVSLRGTARDSAGNTITQTIVNAYSVRAR
jgi:hypothetical protein